MGLGSVADRDVAWFLREIVPKLDGYSLSQIAKLRAHAALASFLALLEATDAEIAGKPLLML